MIRLILLTLLLLLIRPTGASSAHLSRHTTDVGTDTARQWQVKAMNRPRQATIRSLLLPGLGQLYNHEPWKLAIIYGGAGIAAYFLTDNQQKYTDYLTGYVAAYTAPAGSPKTALVYGRMLTVQQLKQASDQYRQQRDLTIILTVAGWALNAIEANVAAHLLHFDLSDDIALRVSPVSLPTTGPFPVPGIRVVICNRRAF